MGRFIGVFLKNPNCLFIAILASQVKNTKTINISSIRITTALSGVLAMGISGERSIEKIRIIRARSVLTKVIRLMIRPPTKPRTNIGDCKTANLPMKIQKKARNRKIMTVPI
jgi:hypothetical protein